MSSFRGNQEYIYDGERFKVFFQAGYIDQLKIKINFCDVEVHEIYREDGLELFMGSLWDDIAQGFFYGDGIEEALVELAEKDQQWQEDRRISDRILSRR